MQRSTERICTTHVGSLPRPAALLDLMKAGADGQAVDPEELAAAEREAVAEVVNRQRAAGLDVVSDGEQSKTGFFAYIGQRLTGFEPRPGRGALEVFRAEIDSFPEYSEQYFQTAMTGGMAAPAVPLACTGPVSYVGQERLRRDLGNLRAAVGDAGPEQVFVCAVAPSGVGANEYYPSQAGYLNAVADALHVEYAAIVDAGFTLQIDDPFLTDVFSYDAGSGEDKLNTGRCYADAINRGLRGIPRERVRLHTCYGINEGPRVHDAPLADLIEILFTIEAGAFSTVAADTTRFNVLKGRTLPPWRYEFITPAGSLQPRSDAKGYFVHTALGPDLMTDAKNAVRGVIDWLVREKSLSREDAYGLCSLAADLKISQIVDAPNWGVSAYLALSVFTK